LSGPHDRQRPDLDGASRTPGRFKFKHRRFQLEQIEG